MNGHEKIRFRRQEIAGLDSFPSAAAHPQPRFGAPMLARTSRIVTLSVAGLAALLVVLVGAVFAIGNFSFTSERLAREAQIAISELAGRPVETRLGPSRVSLDGSMLLALEVSDVSITGEGLPPVEAQFVRFGMHVLPLIRGRLELGSAVISGARIDLSEAKGLVPIDVDGSETVDPDQVLQQTFGAVHALLDTLGGQGTSRIDLRDVELILPRDAAFDRALVRTAELRRPIAGEFTIAGEMEIGGHTVSLSSSAARPARAHEAAKFEVDIAVAALSDPVPPEDPDAGRFLLGTTTVRLSGTQATGARPDTIRIDAELDDMSVKFRGSDPVVGDIDVDAYLAAGADKIEFERVNVASGRSRFLFNGAIGLVPPESMSEADPPYRFEFVSQESVFAPADSNERALPAAITMSGLLSRDGKVVLANNFAVATANGEVLGSGALDLSNFRHPGISLAIASADLPVADVKNLWPWFAASGARRWAMDSMFGGTLESARVLVDIPPGSLGNGVPLNAEEISGRFAVRGSRFDLTGTIPPVRDAVGQVEFKGTDVDVAVESGTVFLPSGRTVSARDATLAVRDAHIKPLIGRLATQIEGAADAVLEIATYEPIDIRRHVDLDPDDLSGDVTGRIDADIPLEPGARIEELDWKVDLAYSDLSLAEPFEGQTVSEADGTIVAVPAWAMISAKAKLNGVDAELSVVEPFGDSEADRELAVTMRLDEDSAAATLPGLEQLVSGPVSISFQEGSDRRTVSADLTATRLDIPWIGWSKGAGVKASANFDMREADGLTTIEDFRLSGDSFSALGSLSLDAEGLVRAEFSRFALRRGDEASATITREGGGYAIRVRGQSFDARSVIAKFSHFTGEGPGETGEAGGGDALDFSVDAELDSVTGFGDERLDDVRLVFSQRAGASAGIRASAVTRAGAAVTLVDASAGASRKVEMQTGDAGALVRFLDIYANLTGGTAALTLSSVGEGPLTGQLDMRDFAIIDEARLQQMVSRAPAGSQQSLNQVVRRDVDVSRARFDRGFARIDMGDDYLRISDGVVRGPTVGSTFQGTVFDANGDMSVTGTFMPAYGLNRIFGEIPLIGALLGNGRDRGLIGITYRITGKTSDPRFEVNPLSIVAPGIFRSIFEYR